MAAELFNPFLDRQSRDLRNDLSSAFATAVESGERTQLDAVVAVYRQLPLASCYRRYLEERSELYHQALATITAETATEPLARGVILWNLGLYFEVHEVLEHSWYSAKGEMKETLQAMIRAAGVYIKRECGLLTAANKIAAKAIPVLRRNQQLLAPYFAVAPLVAALADEQAAPPHLS
jgi:uncharacterized protein